MRLAREAVRGNHLLGMFVEGTRQRGGEPGKALPGAAMVAIQEGVPVVPAAIYGSHLWRPGNFAPVSVAFGEPTRFDHLPKNSKGYREATAEIEAEIRRLWEFLGDDAPARPAARRPAQAGARSLPRRRMSAPLLGTVAVVGFPNVGKSTFVNRLTATRQAVVFETPGVTRDRKEIVCEWAGRRFLLVDTGGVDLADDSPITRQVGEQARRAVAEADLILFVVDARAGVTPGDEELADILRRAGKPVIVAREQGGRAAAATWRRLEFHKFGLGEPVPVSALHGHGTGDLLDRIVAALEESGAGRDEVGEEAVRVAILGRPNVGKSSLLNAIVGEERVIVSEVPGTTRDAIDTVVRGARRRSSSSTRPAFGASAGSARGSSTTRSFARSRPPSAPTSRSSSWTRARGSSTRTSPSPTSPAPPGCSTLVVLSKWDIAEVGIEDVRPRLEDRLRQRPAARRGLGEVRARACSGCSTGSRSSSAKHTSRVTTGELNRFLQELRAERPGPEPRTAGGSTSSTARR